MREDHEPVTASKTLHILFLFFCDVSAVALENLTDVRTQEKDKETKMKKETSLSKL